MSLANLLPTIPILEFPISLENYDRTYTLGYYFPTSNLGGDKLSSAVRNFKMNGIHRDNSILFQLVAYAIQSKLQKDIAPKITIILRALGHNEQLIKTTRHPLDKFGAYIFELFPKGKAFYAPQLLFKPGGSHSRLRYKNAEERQNIVENSYLFNGLPFGKKSVKGEGLTVLVIDDVMTTGATLIEIGRSIKKDLPEANMISFPLLSATDNEDWDGRQYNTQVVNSIRVFGTLFRNHNIV